MSSLFVPRKPVNLDRSVLHTPKKVALIACPWIFYDRVEFRSQQLGLGYIGAYAELYGHKVVSFIDPMVGGGENVKIPLQTKHQLVYRFGHPDEWIVEQIPKDVDVIGINAPFTDSRLVLFPLVNKIKTVFPNVPIVVGGVLATTLPRQVLKYSMADIVVKGEGEIAFTRILNGEDLDTIPGVLYRQLNGEIFESQTRSEQLLTMADIPPPSYDFRPMDQYVKWSPRGDQADVTLSVISSRGCPFKCTFCSIPEKGQRWRPFTTERVLEEIKMAIDRWGVNHIEFEDDNFTLNESRALGVLEGLVKLRKQGYPIYCSFPNGVMVDKMTRDIIVLMRDAGTDIAYLPVESGDPRILAGMNKLNPDGHLDRTLEVARMCVEVGLFVSCFFIVAYPGGKVMNRKYIRPEYEQYLMQRDGVFYMSGEDEKSFAKTIGFCQKLSDLGVGGITPLIATPYPGTELYEYCEKFNCLAFSDGPDVLTTVSYAAMRPEFVQIDSSWCSRQRAFERWQYIMDNFPTYHNVRKTTDSGAGLLSGKDLK